jgi:hypothetical protein
MDWTNSLNRKPGHGKMKKTKLKLMASISSSKKFTGWSFHDFVRGEKYSDEKHTFHRGWSYISPLSTTHFYSNVQSANAVVSLMFPAAEYQDMKVRNMKFYEDQIA